MTTNLPLTPHKRAVLQAWLEGKTVQINVGGDRQWVDVDPNNVALIYEDDSYRIKPTPTRRFWKPEEIPVGWQIRRIGDNRRTIIRNHGDECAIPSAGVGIDQDNFMHYEVAPPGPANAVTWVPAGVEE